ncbi:uncharacterized protein LOC133898611 [Phragmites australis]|uniref:uncharacterized protein LOC133898611 n=1 Tax=Phragmites australis TaxID=29695 RepID=UPI002D7655C4|nr:uncharacterized protein LOC133898611 [Phragmites australis]
MAQREVERAALATERAQLTMAWRVFDSRLAMEDEQHAMEEGRKALEEARAEAAYGRHRGSRSAGAGASTRAKPTGGARASRHGDGGGDSGSGSRVGPADAAAEVGMAEAAAVSGPADAAAEARGEPSAQPAPGQPADPLPVAIESVRVTVERLGAAVDGEVAQLVAERATLATERAQPTTAWRAFESRLVTVRTANEEEQSAMKEARAEAARERKFLEDTRAEVAREREVLENTRAEVARELEDAACLEEASRQQVKLAAGHAPDASSSGTVGGQGLEEQLRVAKEQLEAAFVARASLQHMLEDTLRQMRRSMVRAGLGRLVVETKGDGPGRFVLGFQQEFSLPDGNIEESALSNIQARIASFLMTEVVSSKEKMVAKS